MKLLLGLVAIGGAVFMSRSRTAGGLGDYVPADQRGEALEATERAARALYAPVDVPRENRGDILWYDDDYVPDCMDFAENALDALSQAILAEQSGLADTGSIKVAAVQAWSLAQTQCPDMVSPPWAIASIEA